MYGLVNRAVRDLVVSLRGEPGWQRIRERAGCPDEEFLSMQTYPDELTYRLVGAASEELGLPASQVLHAFGEHWILYTAQKGYSDLLDGFGHSTREFLSRLNDMHGRVETVFSEMSMPYFELQDHPSGEPERFVLLYQSQRPGLSAFVVGLLHGLAKRFGETIEVSQTDDRSQGAAADRFEIRIQHG